MRAIDAREVLRMWEMWKKGFYAWETATASYLERVLRSEMVLKPSGQLLTAAMKMKAKNDASMARAWALVGLPTRRDQERGMHQLNELQSRLIDFEDQIFDLRAQIKDQDDGHDGP
jgi:hypothetical protein